MTTPNDTSTTCPKCHGTIEPGERFCRNCGTSLSGEQPARTTELDLLQRATLGEYEILRVIGQGGMATVYLAHDLTLNRKVAIKVISPDVARGAEMIARFKREARTAAALTHPHIIPIYAVKETEDLIYFVMKYVQGRSLDAILRDVGPLPFPMVRTILADVGSALDFAHRQSVIHRDVKPGNILVEEEGFAVITDFGIAKAAESESLTRSGTTVGTPSYLSPEACAGEKVGPAADQYSLGIVGYEMITGQLPFVAESSLGMMYAQVHTPPRPSTELRSDTPADLHDTIMQMLEKLPEDRFDSLKEAMMELQSGQVPADEHVRSHIGLLAVPRPGRPGGDNRRTPNSPLSVGAMRGVTPVSSSQRRRQKKRRQRMWAVTGAVAFGIAILAAIVLTRPRPGPQVAPDSTHVAPNPTDTLYLSARGAASYARQLAVAGGTPVQALHAGDSLQAEAESLATLGRKAEAAVLLTSAAALWQAATPHPTPTTPSRPAPVQAGPPAKAVTGPTASEKPASATVTPEPAPSDSMQIVRYYRELEEAIRTRQLSEVKRLLPNLGGNEEKEWRNLFNEKNLTALDAVYTVRSVTREGDGATALVKLELTLTKKDKFEHREREDRATLTNGPQGWRQVQAERAQ
jgi:serine/threonine protein kinase